jgi:hypothetical protein
MFLLDMGWDLWKMSIQLASLRQRSFDHVKRNFNFIFENSSQSYHEKVQRDSTDHFVARDARLFISILLATGWSFLGFSSSLRVGLAIWASANGVGTSFRHDGLRCDARF